MNLDILIPIYQPHQDWEQELIAHYRQFKSMLPEGLQSRLIMVNDGSQRNLGEDAQRIIDAYGDSKFVSYEVNRGKGYALRQAAAESDAELVMYTDYDFPYTYDSMIQMVNLLMDTKAEAVVGNRDDSYYNHISPRRRRISQFLKNFNRILFRLPTDDTQCGLKAFDARSRDIFLTTTTDRYLIDVEFLKKLSKNNIKVAVVPVVLRQGVKLSKISNLSLIREGFNYLRIMLGNF